MTIPNAKVAPRTTAKMGMIGAFSMSPRRTAARGATKIAVKAGRQSWRAVRMISSWNKPNHGASRNHPATSERTPQPSAAGKISQLLHVSKNQ